MAAPEKVASPPIAAPQIDAGPSAGPLYWMLVATFSFYTPFWAYRQGRDLRSEGRSRVSPLRWAALSLLVVTLSFVLHNLAREACARSRSLGLEPRVSPGLVFAVAALLHGVSLASLAIPLVEALPLLLVAALPIPVVMVHREVARARRAAGAPAGRLSWPARGLALAGSVLVGFAYWGAFRTGDLHRLVGASLPPDARVAAASGAWSVAPAASGWVRVPAGRVGDANSDLELLGPDGESWLVGYVNASPASALDATVARRTQILQAAGRFRDVREKRFFYPGLDLAPASLARYELSGWPRTVYQVLTVADEARTIEVIALADETESETRMRALLETVVIVPESAP